MVRSCLHYCGIVISGWACCRFMILKSSIHGQLYFCMFSYACRNIMYPDSRRKTALINVVVAQSLKKCRSTTKLEKTCENNKQNCWKLSIFSTLIWLAKGLVGGSSADCSFLGHVCEANTGAKWLLRIAQRITSIRSAKHLMNTKVLRGSSVWNLSDGRLMRCLWWIFIFQTEFECGSLMHKRTTFILYCVQISSLCVQHWGRSSLPNTTTYTKSCQSIVAILDGCSSSKMMGWIFTIQKEFECGSLTHKRTTFVLYCVQISCLCV